MARRLHASQVDPHGKPYIDHLVGAATYLVERWPGAPDHEVDAALLHDSREDQGATAELLLAAGINALAVEIIIAVSRPVNRGLSYLAWIAELARAAAPGVLRVKLADNWHNRLPSRALPGSDLNEKRYEPAARMLEARYAELTAASPEY